MIFGCHENDFLHTKKRLSNRDSLLILSHLSDSNQRPADYKSAALPTELKWLNEDFKIKEKSNIMQEKFDFGQVYGAPQAGITFGTIS